MMPPLSTGMSPITVCLVGARWMFTIAHHIYCYPAYFLWLLLIWPLHWCKPSLHRRLVQILEHLLVTMATWYNWSAGYGVVEVGDDVTQCLRGNTLVLVNHQTPGDILILFNILHSRYDALRNSLFIMNEEFKYAPFGLMTTIKFRNDFFIPIGRERREQGLVDLKKHLKQFHSSGKTIVLFPEGGFLKKRRAKSQKYALEHNLPVLQHVCLPRVGAVQAIFGVCGKKTSCEGKTNHDAEPSSDSRLAWVLDMTIAYPGGNPLGLMTVGHATRRPFHTTVLYRVFPATQIADGQITSWLYSRWQEKEHILSSFYSTGVIPAEKYCSNPRPARLLTQDPVKHMFTHVFFLSSTVIFYRLFNFILFPDLLLILVAYLVFMTLKIKKVF